MDRGCSSTQAARFRPLRMLSGRLRAYVAHERLTCSAGNRRQMQASRCIADASPLNPPTTPKPHDRATSATRNAGLFDSSWRSGESPVALRFSPTVIVVAQTKQLAKEERDNDVAITSSSKESESEVGDVERRQVTSSVGKLRRISLALDHVELTRTDARRLRTSNHAQPLSSRQNPKIIPINDKLQGIIT